MPKGLYRDEDWACVDYNGRETIPISRALYQRRRYQPPFDQLPTKEQYEYAKGTERRETTG